MQGPVLETERLILRPQIADDFEPWAAFMGDEAAARYFGGAQPKSVAWRGFCTVAGAWAVFGYSMFSVVDKASGRWIGRLGPWKPEGWPGTEVGWGIVRDCWGKGYATEGATAALDWAFERLGWTEVIHCIRPDNARSQAVATRLGSRNLRVGFMAAPYDHEPVDIWGQTRDEWRARRK